MLALTKFMKVAFSVSAACIISFPALCDTPKAKDCDEECSSRRAAGYEWAEGHNVTDKEMCPEGDSEAFYDGCVAYAKMMAPNPPADKANAPK